jgi:hypothetical protein
MADAPSKVAYATFLDSDNEYVLGVLALARSLRLCGCRFDLIVGALPNVPEATRALLDAEPNGESDASRTFAAASMRARRT